MKKLVLALCLASASTSYAQVGSAIVVTTAPAIDAGVADATPAPSSTLHDPTTDPKGAIQDLRDANQKKPRWPLIGLIILIGLAKALPFLGGKFAPIGKFLTTGKRAMYLAAVGGLALVAYDSLASGGTWYSAGYAVGLAIVALLSPHAPASAVEKQMV